MSQNIRDLIHDYIEHEITDDRLNEAAQLLSEAGDAGHKIPFTIKVTFGVDKDGAGSIRIGHSANMKVPEWDSPLKLDGRQMDLFSPRAKVRSVVPTNSPGAEPEAQFAVPEPEPEVPGLAIRQEPEVETVPKTQKDRLSSIKSRNAALLAKVKSGDLVLSPAAQKALEEQEGAE